MFSDKYRLTEAVLEGRKTQTRRIVKGAGASVLNFGTDISGTKSFVSFGDILGEVDVIYSTYCIGEVVAIAQAYKDCKRFVCLQETAGFNNKMFVKAELMPHHIRITDVRIERLQDCSDENILEEGIFHNGKGYTFKGWTDRGVECGSDTPKGAFKALIDKTCGRGTFETNPYVFVYSFELVD